MSGEASVEVCDLRRGIQEGIQDTHYSRQNARDLGIILQDHFLWRTTFHPWEIRNTRCVSLLLRAGLWVSSFHRFIKEDNGVICSLEQFQGAFARADFGNVGY